MSGLKPPRSDEEKREEENQANKEFLEVLEEAKK